VGPGLAFQGNLDVFVSKVNPAGTALLYSGFIGGTSLDEAYGIAVDSAGSAYVTGQTSGFEAVVGPDLTYNFYGDAFVAKVNPTGTGLDYGGYLGGIAGDLGAAISVDAEGAAYVAGITYSSDFPAVAGPGLCWLNTSYTDGFVAKVNAAGTELVYSGCLGGGRWDGATGIAVDAEGSAYVTGWTGSHDFPVVVGPDLTYNGYFPGFQDAFAAKVSGDGAELLYAGFVGGTDGEQGASIAVDPEGNAFITGHTVSNDFPAAGSGDLSYNGDADAFVAKVSASGHGLVYASYLGGYSTDNGYGIALDAGGSAYLTGRTWSSDFPTTPGAFDTGYNGSDDAFVTKLDAAFGLPPRLDYAGPRFLGARTTRPVLEVIQDEADGRITMGDHVKLRLRFANAGAGPAHNATVQVQGSPGGMGEPGVEIHDGSTWSSQHVLTLTPETINPGEVGMADFWIYIENLDYSERHTTEYNTWIDVRNEWGSRRIGIALDPIQWMPLANAYMTGGSCLHHPDYGEPVWQYAQYAAGAPKTPQQGLFDSADPDSPVPAIRNVVNRVNEEFHPFNTWIERWSDIDLLLLRRHRYIGMCRHYADLTTGLLRSLGLPSRIVTAFFEMTPTPETPKGFNIAGHAWVEAYVDTADGWLQADSHHAISITQQSAYEDRPDVVEVSQAWADRFPLCSAAIRGGRVYRCDAKCYQQPVDCAACLGRNKLLPTLPLDASCVDDVRSVYHNVAMAQQMPAASAAGQLLISLQSPTHVTRTVPFSIASGILNDSSLPLDVEIGRAHV